MYSVTAQGDSRQDGGRTSVVDGAELFKLFGEFVLGVSAQDLRGFNHLRVQLAAHRQSVVQRVHHVHQRGSQPERRNFSVEPGLGEGHGARIERARPPRADNVASVAWCFCRAFDSITSRSTSSACESESAR